ncbi:cytochrome P450 [Zopfochytrium polystomum]|nr:cytochrome P450 [Zopfochytrium polystomum]
MLSLSRLILAATAPSAAAVADSAPSWRPSVSTLTVAAAVAVPLAAAAAAAALVLGVVLPPRNFPRDVPVVPFWVSLLPFVRKQRTPAVLDELYKKFIRPRMNKKGIVTMWFGGRWNLLVGHPRYARALFLNTETFIKSGNNAKLPYSLIAYYTGENIIASHGATWSRFRRVVAPALKQRAADGGPHAYAASVDAFCGHVDAAAATREGRLVVGDLVQRFCMDAVSGAVLGRSLETLTTTAGHALSQTVLRVKRGIFDPLFLFFPALDRLALLLRGSARSRLRKDVDALYAALVAAVTTGKDAGRVAALRVADAAGLGTPGAAAAAAAREERAKAIAAAAAAAGGKKKAEPAATASLMEAMLDAVEAGEWSVTDFRYNFMILFIAGHENVQQCLTSLLYMLAIHQDAQDRCRREARFVLGGAATSISTWTPADTARLVYLSKLANRQAAPAQAGGAVLDDVVVPRGAYVAWHSFGLHHSEAVWRDPDAFDPERWGDDGRVRGGGEAGPLAEDPFAFISFAAGLRQCLGQKLAMTEVTTFMAAMLLRYRWSLPADREFKMTPAGILAPVGLELMVEAL